MYPKATTLEALRENIQLIEKRIVAAAERAGRDPKTIRLLPVSKTVDASLLKLMLDLGYTWFGENKVQEAQQKHEILQPFGAKFSVIGHLQSNKVKYVARFASEFQALDSLEIAALLNQKLLENGRELEVLIQINTSNEPSKFGLKPEEAKRFVEQLAPFNQLKVKGLMTLALLSEESERVRDCFITLRQLRDHLQSALPDGMRMDELSMGMSGDFETAILEGSTIVRVGQAIFGARQYPDSYYWNENHRDEPSALGQTDV